MSTDVITKPLRTMMEAFRSLPEGILVQLIENNIVMSPAPLDRHQRILFDIYLQLGAFVKKYHLERRE